MLIDWFTVAAQALNFIILVWLLKRYLYKPILNAIDARETRIARELAAADTKKAEARKEHEEFQHKNAELDRQGAALLAQAVDEAKAERQRLLEEARRAAEAYSTRARETSSNEARASSQSLTRRTQQEVFSIARKALADLADTSLEQRMSEVFTRRLRELNAESQTALSHALQTSAEPALVRSAFDLSQEQQDALHRVLHETLSADVGVRFKTAPELVSGIELTANGQRVSWTIADYLASLEKTAGEILNANDRPEHKAQLKADEVVPATSPAALSA